VTQPLPGDQAPSVIMQSGTIMQSGNKGPS